MDSSSHGTAVQQAIADQLLEMILQSQDLHNVYRLVVEGLQQGLGVDRVLLVQNAVFPSHQSRLVAQATAPARDILPLDEPCNDCRWLHLLGQLPHEGLWTMGVQGDEFVELDPVQGEFCQILGIKSLLHLPLVINQRHWGILSLQYLHQARPWPLGDQQFAQRMAHLFCLGLMKTELWIHCQNHKNALQTMVAEGQIQKETYLKSAQREQAIADVIDKIRFTLDLRSLFQTTVTEVGKLLAADRVVIIKIRQNKNFSWGEIQAEAQTGEKLCPLPPEEKVPLSSQWIDHFARGLILAVDDTDEQGADFAQSILGLPKANLVVPLFSGDRLWGVLSVHQYRESRAWESSEIEFTFKIALNLGVALQQAELLTESQRRSAALQSALGEVEAQKDYLARIAEEERALTRVIEGIRQTLELQTIFRATSDEVRHLLSCDRVLVYRFNPDWSGEFIHESVAQMWEPLLELDGQNKCLLWQDTYLQETQGGRYRQHESLAVGDVETAGFSDCHLANLRQFEIRAFLTVPVFVGEQLWGLLGAYQNGAPRHWQAREIHLLHQIANQLGVAVYQAQLLARFQEQSKTMENTLADLTAIVDNLADGLLVIDLFGRITRYNPALLAMFDLEGLELLGAGVDAYFPATLNQLLAKPERQEQQVVTADVALSQGRQGQALITSITSNEDGCKYSQCLGAVIMIRDVTHEREVERMKTDFLATVSHELRTPLTSILGFATVIQDKLHRVIIPELDLAQPSLGKATERVMRNLSIIESEAHRLTALINDVLDIAKMEAGQESWQANPCAIGPIVERAIATITPQAQGKNISLQGDLKPDLPDFIGDENRILQVVLNLLSNAVKFSADGLIIVRSHRHQDYLWVEIIDHGPGIHPADQAKIFEPFQQGGDVLTDKPQGTGLGLPICKKIVEHHGGIIGVNSSLGQGSTFYFSLPIPGPEVETPPVV
ncbi:GAF domain-containing protein [Synechocystis salina]|uniref:GAF domain-containing protein n=1 Tax=Synechocystis salina TaxID=945780 RepID=UPI001D139052|nr:GAF domain-containing protein [Synechocystis salina]